MFRSSVVGLEQQLCSLYRVSCIDTCIVCLGPCTRGPRSDDPWFQMPPCIEGGQEAEGVAVLSPHQLALRLLATSSSYKRLHRRLQRVGPRVARVEEAAVGLCCLVSVEGAWHRAKVEEREEDSCLVRLVDEARREVVAVEELRRMPKQFFEEHAFCFMVHLPACLEEGVGEVLDGTIVVLAP